MTEPYEARFAAIFGSHYHAFSFWKGRVGLYAILKALNLGTNAEVILPGYTCVAVPNAIRFAGGRPVYADIVPGGFNLDPRSVRRRVTSRTRALIVQHTYGIPADMDELRTISNDHGLDIIEDCTHVLAGSTHRGQLSGSFGKAAFFSSQWSKPYTTGLGGMVVTRDGELAQQLERIQRSFDNPPSLQRLQLQIQLLLYRRFFKPKLYWHAYKSFHWLSKIGLLLGSSTPEELIGKKPSDICWKMSEFQQRMGLAQIDGLQSNSDHRQLLSRIYCDIFQYYKWPISSDLLSGELKLLRFPLEIENKGSLLKESSKAGIEIGSWFETPLHPLPLSDHDLAGYQLGSCPTAEAAASRVINLPLHERVTRSEAERITYFVLSQALPACRKRPHVSYVTKHSNSFNDFPVLD